eukprot:gene50320-61565_t
MGGFLGDLREMTAAELGAAAIAAAVAEQRVAALVRHVQHQHALRRPVHAVHALVFHGVGARNGGIAAVGGGQGRYGRVPVFLDVAPMPGGGVEVDHVAGRVVPVQQHVTRPVR